MNGEWLSMLFNIGASNNFMVAEVVKNLGLEVMDCL